MSERLPPLNALRAFVAVAASQSISRAAADLHLTHSAVSHQIRLLQDDLGVALFEKHGRGLRLTPAGAVYAGRIGSAFATMSDATRELRREALTRPLRVSCMPSFAATWLMPRLGEFIVGHPEFDVEVQATTRIADVKGGEVDIAVRFGRGIYPGLHVERLMQDWYFPVCSPEFARRHRLEPPGRSTAAIERRRVAEFAARFDEIPLLRSDNEPWSPWFESAGVTGREPSRGPIFDDSSLMLLAAAAGQGVCLGRHAITMDQIADGRLVRPFTSIVESPNAYWFVCRPAEYENAAIAAFRTWIVARADAMPACQ